MFEERMGVCDKVHYYYILIQFLTRSMELIMKINNLPKGKGCKSGAFLKGGARK